MKPEIKTIRIGIFVLMGILLTSLVIGASYSRSSLDYMSSQGIGLSSSFDPGKCEAGQDFILQINPTGCSPRVVRSDLLEEQNVPVFCPIIATKINPLIDVNAIESMTFSGKYPKEVSGVGFHPAQAAIKDSSTLLNSPLMNNIGYAVIVLKKQANESAMPDFVEGNLTVKIKYDIKNAFGIGKASFYLEQMPDDEWNQNYKQYSFWDGKAYLRAEDVQENSATISIYTSQDRKLSSFTLKKGETSNKVYLPEAFCLAGLQVKLNDLENPGTRVKLKIDDDFEELTINQYFLENRCRIKDIKKQGLVKTVSIYCKSDEKEETGTFDLSISPKISFEDIEEDKILGDKISSNENNYFIVHIDSAEDETQDKDLIAWVIKNPESKYIDTTNSEEKLNENGIQKYFLEIQRELKKDKTTAEIDNKLFKLVYKTKNQGLILEGYAEPDDEKNSEENDEKSTTSDNYKNAIENYKKLAEDFSFVQQKKNSIEIPGAGTYAEAGLKEAANLADELKNYEERDEILRLLLDKYPTEQNSLFAEQLSNSYKNSNSGVSSKSILINNERKTIYFENVYESELEDYGVEIYVNQGDKEGIQTLEKNKKLDLGEDGAGNEKFIELKSLTQEYAQFSTNIADKNKITTVKVKLKENLEGNIDEDKYSITLNKIYLTNIAEVSVIPNIDDVGTSANISFEIGIEKRSIELSPEKIKNLIAKLNKTIDEWEDKSEDLGKVVKGMKTACLTTGLVLTVKNFFASFGGEVAARQKAMEQVRAYCTDLINNPTGKEDDTFKSVSDCIDANGNKIDEWFDINKKIINEQNKNFKDIQGEEGVTTTQGITSFVNAQKEKELYCEKLLANNIILDIDQTKCQELSISDLREAEYCSMLKTENEELWKQKCESWQKDFDKAREDEKQTQAEWDDLKKTTGVPPDAFTTGTNKDTITKIYSGKTFKYLDDKNLIGVDKIGKCIAEAQATLYECDGISKKGDCESINGCTWKGINDKTPIQFHVHTDNKKYLIILNPPKEGYSPAENGIYLLNGNELSSSDVKINIRFNAQASYTTAITNPEVRYFMTGADKGYPSIIPFPFPGKEKNGWYVGIRHLTTTSQVQDSGAVERTYFVCNAMDDGVIDFKPGASDYTGKDDCSDVSALTKGGNPFKIGETQTQDLYNQAEKAIRAAQQQSGKTGIINILGMDVKVGEGATDIPEMRCEDFMSPKDCSILFNVCDPVICPSSRCNLGGNMYVNDVIQSGIVGSIFLCLPNFGNPMENTGKVIIPICLSGLKAGIDGLLSILKDYRSCLQEKLDTGATVGVCDEIYSIYLCDFFWGQIAPLADSIIPSLIQVMTGQRVQGGGEYLGVAAAWDNAGKSIDYFSQYYAANSFKDLKTQVTKKVKNEVCKNFISVSAPDDNLLDSLTDPDSPPQFSGRFEEKTFTTATIPPISQYSVFYHIYAGKERGVNYRVYLKNPKELVSGYQNIAYLTVASGYINKGETASEKKDFTSPSGYQELCIMVDAQEECGFEQVSTSFAVNYVKDKYMEEQASQTNITTEENCKSGTSSLYSFLNPNLQAGTENFVNPDISEKGIIRVCSTNNPEGSNSSRWADVGYCGDQNLRCWIDTNSIKDVIETKNIENNTLSEVITYSLEQLIEEGYMNFDAYNQEITDLIDKIKKDSTKINEAITRIELIEDTTKEPHVFFTYQHAELLLLKARAYASLTKVKEVENATETTTTTPTTNGGDEETNDVATSTDINEEIEKEISMEVSFKQISEQLEEKYVDKLVLEINHNCYKVNYEIKRNIDWWWDKVVKSGIINNNEEKLTRSTEEFNVYSNDFEEGEEYYANVICYDSEDNNIKEYETDPILIKSKHLVTGNVELTKETNECENICKEKNPIFEGGSKEDEVKCVNSKENNKVIIKEYDYTSGCCCYYENIN